MASTESASLRKTPLYDRHIALGGRMTPFAGYEMPLRYTDGILEEHRAVRREAGLFDVSHMGEILVRGPHAATCVQYLVTNETMSLQIGQAVYTCMCREDGGIVDDLIVYRLAEEEYLLVVNAANRQKDFMWMIRNNPAKAIIEDISDGIALIAVQGPRALAIAEAAIGEDMHDLKPFRFRRTSGGCFAGARFAIVSATGYTGEAGVEIYCDAGVAGSVWDTILEVGADEGLKPAGLGARDTLRMEAGLRLYGNDITEETNPVEAGLGRFVRMNKEDFIGKSVLERVHAEGPSRKLVAFVVQEQGAIPRSGHTISTPVGPDTGVVTSGTQSPMLGRGIGLGYVPNEPACTMLDSQIDIAVRSRTVRALVKKPPLHKI